MDETYVSEFIFTSTKRRGNGKHEGSPVRIIEEIFSRDGKKVAEFDKIGNYSIEDIHSMLAKKHYDPDKNIIDIINEHARHFV